MIRSRSQNKATDIHIYKHFYPHHTLNPHTPPPKLLPQNQRSSRIKYVTTSKAPNPAQQLDSQPRSPRENATSRRSTVPSHSAGRRGDAGMGSGQCNRRGGFGRRICLSTGIWVSILDWVGGWVVFPGYMCRVSTQMWILVLQRSLETGGRVTYCEQKANRIGIQLLISLKIPPTTGQSIAFRRPNRTCSRSCSDNASGMRSAL